MAVKSYGNDRCGRTLSVVFVNGMNLNLEIISARWAAVYREPPAKGLDLKPYWKAEKDAREAGRGIWSLGNDYIGEGEIKNYF